MPCSARVEVTPLPKIIGIKCLAYDCWPHEVFSCERVKYIGCEGCPYAYYVTVVDGRPPEAKNQ